MLPSLHDAHMQAPLTPDCKATPQFASVEGQVSRQIPPATDDCSFGVIGQLIQEPPTPSDDVPAGQLIQNRTASCKILTRRTGANVGGDRSNHRGRATANSA